MPNYVRNPTSGGASRVNLQHVVADNEARRIGPRERVCIACESKFTAGQRSDQRALRVSCRRDRKLEQDRGSVTGAVGLRLDRRCLAPVADLAPQLERWRSR